MAGGGAGFGAGTGAPSGASSPYSTSGIDSTMADNFGGAAQTAPTSQAAPADYYASLARPSGDVIRDAYIQSLGREPDTAGANYWANEAQRYGLTGQQVAERISMAGEPERAQSGYQNQLNPQNYTTQRVGAMPSYYNTNPYTVDYANIFNPRAASVLTANQALTPQQQAAYLGDWQQDYSNRLSRSVANARAQRVANAQKAQEDYNTKKAQAEAQAAASNQEAINKAVQEALAQQQSQSDSYVPWAWTGGASGGIASLAKGFKK